METLSDWTLSRLFKNYKDAVREVGIESETAMTFDTVLQDKFEKMGLPMVDEPREMSVPLTVKQWAEVFDCTEDEALKRLEEMEKQGNATCITDGQRAERCETCRFLDCVESTCQRHAPLPIQPIDNARKVWWQEVRNDDWCGEWQSKTDEKIERISSGPFAIESRIGDMVVRFEAPTMDEVIELSNRHSKPV